jgi:mono/diheme cytochrome c family protein
MLRLTFLLVIVVLQEVAVADSTVIDFASQVQPILARKCFACHGPDDQQSGIRLDRRETLTGQADSGAIALVPTNPEASEIIVRVRSEDESVRMPPEGDPLTDEEIAVLTQWIQQGGEIPVHWAFQPITSPQPPACEHADQAAVPLDLFVFNKLEAAQVNWVPPADPIDLIRRVYFDVIGLPPSPEEISAWLDRWSPSAYEQLVDQLLADPRFGERWARTWLDVVRYAESNSFERDNPKPNAWKYRDYVIHSFNSDKPYDQFVREQLAGDQVDHVTLETLTATAYYRLGLWDDEPADPLQALFDEYDDIISTTGQAFLGLTVGCARCHDHKIDPISQRDYYAMLAFIRDVTPYATRSDQTSNNQVDLTPEISQQSKEIRSGIQKLSRRMAKIEQRGIERMSAPDQRATEGEGRAKVLIEKLQEHLEEADWSAYVELKQEVAELQAALDLLPESVTTLGLAKLNSDPPATFVLARGSPHAEGEQVQPAIPELFVDSQTVEPRSAGPESDALPGEESATADGLTTDLTTGLTTDLTTDLTTARPGRRELADWIASSDNWLTARVIVNRVWLHYFGRGIVRSPNNFGLMGDPPTHPELLDYLARQLIDGGWNMKQLHRQILLSATYQRSSKNRQDSMSVDAANDLFWKQNMKRLSAEQIRDSILAVSGQLNSVSFGPPMYPELSAEVLASQSQPGQNWENSPRSEQARRSIYIHVKRSLPVPLLSVFDFPDTDTSCEARFLTVQPGQALTMLNSQWMQEQSQALLERVSREVGGDLRAQASRCLELVSSRPPRSSDVSDLVDLVERLKQQEGLSESIARRAMCLVALNLNQFVYLE